MTDSISLLTANALPITKNSRLRVSVYSTVANEPTVNLRTAIELPNGEIVYGVTRQKLAPGPGSTSIEQRLTDGRLISVAVFCIASGTEYGDLFGTAEIQEGDVNSPNYRLPIASGYITDYQWLQFPLGGINSTAIGSGGTKTASPADPAAGTNLDWSPGTGVVVHLLTFSFRLDTSVAVATRTVKLQLQYTGTTDLEIWARTNQLAADGKNYMVWAGDNLPADNSDNIYLPFPHQLDSSEFHIVSAINNLAAGDQISQTQVAWTNTFGPV